MTLLKQNNASGEKIICVYGMLSSKLAVATPGGGAEVARSLKPRAGIYPLTTPVPQRWVLGV